MECTLAWDDGMVGERAAERCRLGRGVPCRETAAPACVRDRGDGSAGGWQHRLPGAGWWLLATIDLHPYLPTVSAAAEYALWQRILRSARAKILPGTVATGINRLIQALETS